MEVLIFNLYYFTTAVVVSYFFLWLFALVYSKSSRSSIQIERSVLRGWLLGTVLHMLGVVVSIILTFVLLDFSLLVIQLVVGSICLIIDIILIFVFIPQIKSLPKF